MKAPRSKERGAFLCRESEPINDYLPAFASLPAAWPVVQAHHKPAGRLVQAHKEFDSE